MSIQRWSIEDASEYYEDGTGDMVTYADHISSHAYDEAKELAECRSQWEKNPNCLFSDMLIGWKACAQSRARSAE